MSFQPFDYQSVVNIDRALIEHLTRYLEGKEESLSREILEAINAPVKEVPTEIPYALGPQCPTLSETVEIFRRKIQDHKQPAEIQPLSDWNQAVKKTNKAFHEYIEVIEGNIKELFQQLSLLGFQEWKSELTWVVDSIKELLRQRIEAALFALERLDKLLLDYRKGFSSGFFNGWGGGIDKSLASRLTQNYTLLLKEYDQFMKNYNGYHSLKTGLQELVNQCNEFHTLNLLDKSLQHIFREVYQLFQLREANQSSKLVAPEEITRNIQGVATVKEISFVFRKYAQKLEEVLFQTSRVIKLGFLEESKNPQVIQEEIIKHQTELRSLASTVSKYRDFLLRNDPNPHIQKWWGFIERTVGPEPNSTKELTDLGLYLEDISALYSQLSKELREALPQEESELASIQKEALEIIHEIAQPLILHQRAKRLSEGLTDLLKECHELGATDLSVVDFVGSILAKGMCADWRHQVLQENPSFHQIYDIHKKILGFQGDRAHLKRMSKFKHYFQHLEECLKVGESLEHAHEMEMEINDIKIYLQDFLAFLQRLEKDNITNFQRIARLTNQAQFQVLEYRYLFAGFFFRLRDYGLQGKQLRKQFLFADQWLEYMENKVDSLRLAHCQPKDLKDIPLPDNSW